MICDIEISQLKPNSVLYRDDKGKIICVTKKEFLKEHALEIAEISNEFENLKNNTIDFQKSITGEISRQNERIDAMQQALLDFIEIMKGEPKDEEQEEQEESIVEENN